MGEVRQLGGCWGVHPQGGGSSGMERMGGFKLSFEDRYSKGKGEERLPNKNSWVPGLSIWWVLLPLTDLSKSKSRVQCWTF